MTSSPSPAVVASSQSPLFDKLAFRRMREFGRVYRNQAIELIAICRRYSYVRKQDDEKQDAELTKVLEACDLALSTIVEARKGSSLASNEFIQSARRELCDYELNHHPRDKNTPRSVTECMDIAEQRDKERSRTWKRTKTVINEVLGRSGNEPKTNTAEPKVVNFHLVESLTSTEPIINVVQQELTNRSNTTEILWNFIRCVGKRLTLAKNPHFYRCLPPTSPNASSDKFPLPIESGWHEHPMIYVLSNIRGRIFLECGPEQWAFDNVWIRNGTLIFKRVCGSLVSETIVGASIQGRSCSWCHVELLPPLQPADGPAVDLQDPTWIPVEDWREPIRQTMPSPYIRIRITG